MLQNDAKGFFGTEPTSDRLFALSRLTTAVEALANYIHQLADFNRPNDLRGVNSDGAAIWIGTVLPHRRMFPRP